MRPLSVPAIGWTRVRRCAAPPPVLTRDTRRAIARLGFVPFERTGGEVLLHILADRHGQRSTVIPSHVAFGAWGQVVGDAKVTTARLDQLGQRAPILTTKGPSDRTRRHTHDGSGKTAAE